MGVIGEFFSGGATNLKDKQNQVYDASAEVQQAVAHSMEKTGQYTDAEVNEWLNDQLDENEKNRQQALKDTDHMIASNTALNIIGVAGSAFSGASVAMAGAANTAKVATTTAQVMGASDEVGAAAKLTNIGTQALGMSDEASAAAKITNIGTQALGMSDEASAAAKLTNVTANALGASDEISTAAKIGNGIKTAMTGYGKGVITVSNGLGQIAGGSKLVTGLSRTAIVLAPIAITQTITRSRTNEVDVNLTNTLNALNDRLAYLDENRDKFPQDMQNACDSLNQGYSESMTDYYNQYVSGTISQADYDAKLSEIAEQYNKQYEQLKQDYPQYVNDSCAIDSFQYCADHGIDYNDIAKQNYVFQQDIENNPNIAEAARIMKENKYGTAETEIGSFFKTINATIIKYCPFVASIEAAALKMSDSAFDFIRDTITQHDGVSKYQNQTIADIAESIKQDSAEHLALKAAVKDAEITVTSSYQTLNERNGIETPASTEPETQVSEETQVSPSLQ